MTQPGAGRSRAAALRGLADRAATAETTRKLTACRGGGGRGVHVRRGGAPGRAGAGRLGAVRPRRRPVRCPFVPFTLVLAAAAWALAADPVRAVAVLVVATPCPLLLAAPIAIVSGLSRAARIGVVVKGGGALERLAAGRVMLFDKTGTLTRGRPGLADVVVAGGRMDADELLRLAASLDQVSAHVLASAIVTAATSRGLALEMPADVREVHGYGLEGTVGGHRVSSARPRGSSAAGRRGGCARCAGALTWTAR